MTDTDDAVLAMFRWPVAVERNIAASADDVWGVISTPGNLELVHPYCARNPTMRWPGDDAVDEIHYLNGRVMRRVFRRWIDGIGYDLDIGEPDGPTSFVTWRLTPLEDDRCSLKIVVHPYLLQDVPAVLRWLPHQMVVRPRLEAYLTSVIRGVEWSVRSESPVPRNQWGSHPWFS